MVTPMTEINMGHSNVIVDAVEELTSVDECGPCMVPVRLHMGELVLLDMSTPQAKAWAGILGRMQLTNEAVYLEIDPSTNVVTELLIPRPVKVGRLKSCLGKEDVEVELVICHMRHYLR